MVTQAELRKLIAEEFKVIDILGNENVHTKVSGKRWQQHTTNLATTIWKKLNNK